MRATALPASRHRAGGAHAQWQRSRRPCPGPTRHHHAGPRRRGAGACEASAQVVGAFAAAAVAPIALDILQALLARRVGKEGWIEGYKGIPRPPFALPKWVTSAGSLLLQAGCGFAAVALCGETVAVSAARKAAAWCAACIAINNTQLLLLSLAWPRVFPSVAWAAARLLSAGVAWNLARAACGPDSIVSHLLLPGIAFSAYGLLLQTCTWRAHRQRAGDV
ncbi:unnamed protein product [Pedinophyceae sp. YPF-701]|nr:unnamed protein product [Pedinophyceae sp. YPF-701]